MPAPGLTVALKQQTKPKSQISKALSVHRAKAKDNEHIFKEKKLQYFMIHIIAMIYLCKESVYF